MANPMYRQIAEQLREQIESGVLKPGQQLRTELELRELHGASRNTVRDAIKWLTTLGLVETRPGQGTFVVRKIDPFITTLTADPKRPGGDKVVVPGEGRYGEIDQSGEPVRPGTTSPRDQDSPGSCQAPTLRSRFRRLPKASPVNYRWPKALR